MSCTSKQDRCSEDNRCDGRYNMLSCEFPLICDLQKLVSRVPQPSSAPWLAPASRLNATARKEAAEMKKALTAMLAPPAATLILLMHLIRRRPRLPRPARAMIMPMMKTVIIRRNLATPISKRPWRDMLHILSLPVVSVAVLLLQPHVLSRAAQNLQLAVLLHPICPQANLWTYTSASLFCLVVSLAGIDPSKSDQHDPRSSAAAGLRSSIALHPSVRRPQTYFPWTLKRQQDCHVSFSSLQGWTAPAARSI